MESSFHLHLGELEQKTGYQANRLATEIVNVPVNGWQGGLAHPLAPEHASPKTQLIQACVMTLVESIVRDQLDVFSSGLCRKAVGLVPEDDDIGLRLFIYHARARMNLTFPWNFRFAWVDIVLSNIAHVAGGDGRIARCSLDQAECLMNMILKLQAMLTGRVFPSAFAKFITLCSDTGHRADGAWILRSHYLCDEHPQLHCTMTEMQIGRFQKFHYRNEERSSWEEICDARNRDELYCALDSHPRSCVWRSVVRRRRFGQPRSRWETAAQLRIAYSTLRVTMSFL
jgi:hypothetical protein